MTYNGIFFVCQNVSRVVLFRTIALFLMLLIVWQWAFGVVSFLKVKKMASIPLSTFVEKKASYHHVPLHLALKQDFFGHYVPKNLNDLDVKQSMLHLNVVGILYASDERHSHVILQAEGGREQTFGVGDTVPGDAVIKRITAEGVIVERKGVLERLSFPKNELIFDVPAKPLIKDGVHAF